MLLKSGDNKVLAARGEGDDPNAAVFAALDLADQALRDEANSRKRAKEARKSRRAHQRV